VRAGDKDQPVDLRRVARRTSDRDRLNPSSLVFRLPDRLDQDLMSRADKLPVLSQ
jgi:hypothetical protein